MSYTHDLKIWPEHYQAILDGRKRFEIRSIEDRSFDEGEFLRLREWEPTDPPYYTGRHMTAQVTLVHAGFGTAQGYVVMGIEPVKSSAAQADLIASNNLEEELREARRQIGQLHERIKLLKTEKDHFSLELRYYEDRAYKAEKELYRMGSHGSVVAIPASRFEELERAEKALRSLEGNVEPKRGES